MNKSCYNKNYLSYLIVYINIRKMSTNLDKHTYIQVKTNLMTLMIKYYKLLDELIIEELINYRSNMTHIISNLENNLLVLVTLTKEKNIINWSIHSEINQSNDKLISEFYENKHTIIYMSATLTIRD